MPITTETLRLDVRLPSGTPFPRLLIERIMAAGALDCWSTPLTDHQGRPGSAITIIATASTREAIEEAVFRNSPARQIVATPAEISTIETSTEQVTTRYGDVTITHRRWNGRIIEIEPDPEACAVYARQHDIPANTVWQEAYRIGEARIGQKR